MNLSPTNKHIILYADDDMDDVELVKEVFSKHSKNVEIVCVFNGLEALEYLSNYPENQPSPCLIILDINMPRLDGKQALEEIRKMDRFKDISIVLFTTSTHPMDKSHAQKYNAGFITKPIEFSQMHKIADAFFTHCSDEVRKSIKDDLDQLNT